MLAAGIGQALITTAGGLTVAIPALIFYMFFLSRVDRLVMDIDAVAQDDQDLADFLTSWIELKKADGTVDRLFDYWILGKNAEPKAPRWSIIRDVLHWVD